MTLDYRAGLLAAALVAATYALGRVRLWLAARREAAATARAERAEAERDREAGRAAVSDATAKATADQASRTASGQLDAKEIRDVPITGNPGSDRAALYERDRVLRGDKDRDR